MAGRVAAIVLAAGFSERMGDFKSLLELGGSSALERCVALFRAAGIQDLRIVTGHCCTELEPLLTRLGVRNIHNPRYREGMFSSVASGMATIESDVEAFFVLPVDIPLVRPATVRRLLDCLDGSLHDVIYPVFQGERGHPPLIAGRRADEIASWHGEGGLKAALAQWKSTSLNVEVADGNILLDMNTPDDLRLLQEKAERPEIPTAGECAALLEKVLCVGEPVIGHGRAVAQVASRLGKELNQTGCGLDIPLIEAAALLHDIAKGKPDHALAGAELLRKYGFGEAAGPVATHMDLKVSGSDKVGTGEILYLADKLVRGVRLVTLEERFRGKMERHSGDPAALAAISGRLETALAIRGRIEAILGKSIEEVLRHEQ